MADKKDMNKFDFVSGLGRGCSDGVHRPDDREGMVKIQKYGDLTMLIYTCLACGMEYGVAAPLGLNEYLGNESGVVTQQEPVSQPQQPAEKEVGHRSEILKKLLE